MLETFDAYLTSLRRRLAIKVGKSKAEELTQEIASHLVAVRNEVLESGKNSEEAEREAIRRMGPDRLLSEDLARSAGGWTRSLTTYTVVPTVLLFGAAVATTQASVIAAYYWILIAFGAMFVWQVARSQRWIAIPVAAMFYGILIALLVQQGLAWQSATVPGLRNQETRLINQIENVRMGMAGKGPLVMEGTRKAPQAFPTPNRAVPYYSLVSAGDSGFADELWKRNGKGLETQLLGDLVETRQSIKARFSWLLVFRQATISALIVFGVLLGINALVLLASTGRRRYLEAKWRVA